jgi:thioesterase domain-containing protein
LKQRGSAYLRARFRHVWSMARNRAKLALESGGENGVRQHSLAYILESLGIEHDRAFANYNPRPYTGDVVLLRASRQLPIVGHDRTLGWKGIIQGNLHIAEVEGHQQNILIEPNVRNAARELDSHLSLAQHAQLVGLDQ